MEPLPSLAAVTLPPVPPAPVPGPDLAPVPVPAPAPAPQPAAHAPADGILTIFKRKPDDPTPHDAIYDPETRERLRSALVDRLNRADSKSPSELTHARLRAAFNAVVDTALTLNRNTKLFSPMRPDTDTAWTYFSNCFRVAPTRSGGVSVPRISWSAVLLAFDTVITLASLPYVKVGGAGICCLALCALRLQQNCNCIDAFSSSDLNINSGDIRVAADAPVSAATVSTVTHRILRVLDFTLPGSLDSMPLPGTPVTVRAACASSHALSRLAHAIGKPTAATTAGGDEGDEDGVAETDVFARLASGAEMGKTPVISFIEQVLVCISLQRSRRRPRKGSTTQELWHWELTEAAYNRLFLPPSLQCLGLQRRLTLTADIRKSAGRPTIRGFSVSPRTAGEARIFVPFEFKGAAAQTDLALTPPRKESPSLLKPVEPPPRPPRPHQSRLAVREFKKAPDTDGDIQMGHAFLTPPSLSSRKRKEHPFHVDTGADALTGREPTAKRQMFAVVSGVA